MRTRRVLAGQVFGGRAVGVGLAAMGTALLLAAGVAPRPSARTAAADGMPPHLSAEGRTVACRACPEPDDAWYRWEMGPFFRDGGAHPDVYETDGGECKAKPLGVKVSVEAYLWEPAGEGLVQDCPSGRFAYELNVRLGPDARFDWQVDAEKSHGLEVGTALDVEAAADAATTGACGRGTTLSLTQRLEASHCHRMRWAAAFLLARLRAKADYAVERRWRWWIKNANWGDEVLYAGDTWRPCDAAHVELTRLAPVSIHLARKDGACPDAECAPVTLVEGDGWVPKPPDEAPPFAPLRPTTVTETPKATAPTESPEAPKSPPPPAAAPVPSPAPDATPDPAPDAPVEGLPCSPYPERGSFPEPGDGVAPAPPGPRSPSEGPSDAAGVGP